MSGFTSAGTPAYGLAYKRSPYGGFGSKEEYLEDIESQKDRAAQDNARKMNRQMQATTLAESYKKFNEGTRLREMQKNADLAAGYLSVQQRQKALSDARRRLYNPGLPEGQ